ncbi:MAG: hypothetical protein Q9207_000009 [Kuettlingeria erythrocarpa]
MAIRRKFSTPLHLSKACSSDLLFFLFCLKIFNTAKRPRSDAGKTANSSKMTTKMCAFAILFLTFTLTNAYYLSPNPWITTATAASANNTTLAATLLPRQDPPRGSGNDVTIYADGAFLDSKYAQYFACGGSQPAAFTTAVLPPAPFTTAVLPSSSTEEEPVPAPTPSEPSAEIKCNTVDRITDRKLEKGSHPASLPKDAMKDLYTDNCNKESRYPIDDKRDGVYLQQDNHLRSKTLIVKAWTVDPLLLPYTVRFNKKRCKENFGGLLDVCECPALGVRVMGILVANVAFVIGV